MLDKQIRASIAHILLTLINADNIIDKGEIMQFSAIKKKHGIIPSDIIDSESMSFAQAVNNISEYAKAKGDKTLLNKIYKDACSIASSDGFCAPCEARILYAMRAIFFSDPGSGIRLMDCKEASIQIDGPKVFFVREDRHADLSKNFIEYFQEYYYEFMNFGFELINIVQICNDLISMGEENVVELMSLGRPNIIKPRASAIYQKLKELTPQEVFKEILGGTLDVINDDITTYFLIKICDSKVAGNGAMQTYYSFIRVPVVSDLKSVIRNIVKDYSECAVQINHIISLSDCNKFRYFDFTKSLFNMLEAEVERSKIELKKLVIDPIKETIYFDGLLSDGIKVQYKQLVLYLLVCWLSANNKVLVRKDRKTLYEPNKEEGHVKNYVEIAEEKYEYIQQHFTLAQKDYGNPCDASDQDFGSLKTKFNKVLKDNAGEYWSDIYDLCIPKTVQKSLPKLDGSAEYRISGFSLGLLPSYIYVKVRDKDELVPISELFN